MTTSGTGNLNPLDPIVNQGNQYINGMRLTWVSTTSFTVGAGLCRDHTNTMDICMGTTLFPGSGAGNTANSTVASTAVTVKTTVTGPGGLDVGTITATKNYSVFAIGDSSGFLNASAVISLNSPTTGPNTVVATASNGITRSYDSWRYIGSVVVDGSNHFVPFMQTGAQTLRTIWFDPGTGPSTKGLAIPSSGTGGSATYVNLGVLTTLMPQTALEAIYNVSLTPNTAGNAIFLSAPTIDNGTTAAVGSMASLSAVVAAKAQIATVRVPVSLPNATQQAGLAIGNVVTTLYATSEASDAVVFLLNGYVDQL